MNLVHRFTVGRVKCLTEINLRDGKVAREGNARNGQNTEVVIKNEDRDLQCDLLLLIFAMTDADFKCDSHEGCPNLK